VTVTLLTSYNVSLRCERCVHRWTVLNQIVAGSDDFVVADAARSRTGR